MATMASVTRYTLNDFETIINNGFKCELSPQILEIVQRLADQVGAPEYIKTPQFIRREGQSGGHRNRSRRRNKKTTELSDEAWEEIRNFEATKRIEKEGIEKSIDIVRKAMNKISGKNYDTLKETIFSELETIINTGIEVEGEEMTKLVDSLYKIASQNGFYSELYAKLYTELVEKYSFIKTPLEKSSRQYITELNTITYTSPDDDYDLFCKNNKDNTKRRSVGIFFVNIVKYKLISVNCIVEIIEEIQDKITNYMEEDGQSEIVDELSELVGEIVPKFLHVMSNIENEDNIECKQRSIIANIREISTLSSKNYPSLSNKAVFKHMDIMDTDEIEAALERLD